MFRLRTFGGLSISGEAGPVPPSATQRRRLALLALLATAGERGLTRDKLLGYLWPESSPERARHALDQLLYASRRDFGKGAVSSSSGTLRLDPLIVRADVTEFESALEHGQLAEAAGLYQGPFLDGVYLDGAPAFERWVESERSRLQERFTGALEELARSDMARGDVRQAVEWWSRLAATDRLSSRFAEGLIRALAAAGDTAGALRQARIHEELVRHELEMEPDPSLVALAERLRQGGAPAPAAAALPAAPATPTAATGPTAPSAPSHSPATWARRRLASVGRVAALVGGIVIVVLGARAALQGRDAGPPGPVPIPDVAHQEGASARAPDPGAHELYLRARMAWNHRSREGLQQAVVLFRQATERDPLYAEAYSGLADAYVILGYLGFVPGDASFPKGKAAALQALALDSTLGKAHAALGKALQWERDWAGAEHAFVRALEYAPRYATGHQWYALLLTILGRGEEAVIHGRHAAELDPLSIQIHNTYGIMLFNAGMLDSALQVYERLVTNEPDTAWVRQNPWVLSNFGKVAAAAGRHEDAVRLVARAAQTLPGHPRPLYELAVAYIMAGDPDAARAAFDGADPSHPHYPVHRGLLHAWLGDLDAAFDWLDAVETWGPVTLVTLSANPLLHALHADPRYGTLRHRVGLPAPD